MFDIFVIGGGSGGLACARRAAQYGAKVGLAEMARLGGTCVNVGCVPKKICYNAVGVIDTLNEISHWGMSVNSNNNEVLKLHYGELKRKRDNYIARLNNIYISNLRAEKNNDNEITRFHGKASVFSNKEVYDIQIQGIDDKLQAKHVLLATGAYPKRLNCPGDDLAINSDQFFELESIPETIAVFGAGYIGLELAGVLKAYGAVTTIYDKYARPLIRWDKMIGDKVLEGIERRGINYMPTTVPISLERIEDRIRITYMTESNEIKTHDVNKVLCAIGRAPCIDVENWTKLGIQLEKSGHVITDEYQNTHANNIYAIGDVVGIVQLTPMAIAAGRLLADRLFGNAPNAKADYTRAPSVVFTHPPASSYGYDEQSAIDKYGIDDIKIYNGEWVNLYYGPWEIEPKDKPKSYVKMLCVRSLNLKVIGLHIVGIGADEMMQGFALAMTLGATKHDFDQIIAIHPTAAEEIVLLPPWRKGNPNKPLTDQIHTKTAH